MYDRVIPPRTLAREYVHSMSAHLDIFRSVIKSKILR